MGFKHTGLFPEQAVNWDWMINKIKSSKREIKVLNLVKPQNSDGYNFNNKL